MPDPSPTPRGSLGAGDTPPPPAPGQVTQILHAAAAGNGAAAEQLLPMVYGELRRLAQGYMNNEGGAGRAGAGQTLQATALVHEAYLRLVGNADVGWNSRGHFFGAAAQAMRRILVERARHRDRIKHGGGRQRVALNEVAHVTETPDDQTGTDLVALDAALDKLTRIDPRKSEVVMLKYFAGLTNDEVAAAIGVSSATVRNEWTFAKAWLMREMTGGPADSAPEPHRA